MTSEEPVLSGIIREQAAALQTRLQQAKWRGRNLLDEGLFVQHYQFYPDQLPGWHVVRSREIRLPDLPPLVRVMLQADDDRNRLLKVDVYEARSREAAHDLIIEILAGFQLLPDEAQAGDQVGDVTFIVSREQGVVFCRSNLVCTVLNAGAHAISANEVATLLDQAIVSKPVPTQNVPAAMTLESTGGGAEAPLHIKSFSLQSQPTEQPPMLKLFSRGGSFYIDDRGDLAFAPQGERAAAVEGYAIAQNGAVSQIEVAFKKTQKRARSSRKKKP